MKRLTAVSLDVEDLLLAKEEGLNISRFCRNALKEYFRTKKESKDFDIDKEIEKASAHLAKLREMKEAKEKEEEQRRKQKAKEAEEAIWKEIREREKNGN